MSVSLLHYIYPDQLSFLLLDFLSLIFIAIAFQEIFLVPFGHPLAILHWYRLHAFRCSLCYKNLMVIRIHRNVSISYYIRHNRSDKWSKHGPLWTSFLHHDPISCYSIYPHPLLSSPEIRYYWLCSFVIEFVGLQFIYEQLRAKRVESFANQLFCYPFPLSRFRSALSAQSQYYCLHDKQ